ncbi:hypothetical protein BDR03DRAFT_1016691 [Suillus americanus]|nr:hypothetical protein BDR03DRAFT_1016691 [Suillus americanus]
MPEPLHHSLDHDTNFSLSPKPQIIKEKRVSATCTAVEDKEAGKCHGIMRYIENCTKEELHDQLKKVEEKLNEGWKAAEEYGEMTDLCRRMEKHEKDRLQQEKHHQKQHEVEISAGLRTPGGSKCSQKRIMMSLRDDSPKRPKHSLTELSRPNRAEKELIRHKKTHQSG